MEGILNVDKPTGMTSHDVVGRVRRIAGMKRVGHAGTLDPLATGVLVLGLGRATRLLEYVVGQPKEYVTTMRLGQVTDSYDADGEIVEERDVVVSAESLQDALSQFKGPIQQIPPMYSAIKKDGQPLYKMARQGIEIEREPRNVTIYALELAERVEDDVVLRIECSTGTYIRSLVHDVGQLLGCGAHVTALRRTRIGEYAADAGVALATLERAELEQALEPAESAVRHLPKWNVDATRAFALGQGKRLVHEAHDPTDPLVRVYNPEQQFVGLVRLDVDVWRPHKMFT